MTGRRVARDAALLAVGLVGIYHEVAIADSERPILVGLFAAMIGLATVLRTGCRNLNPFAFRDHRGKET